MRTNMPVTNNEFSLTDQHLIVSKTDIKGLITYINKDFLEVSGFATDELIGKPHNIVRHPDMPTEAFEDLWKTLKEGRPWTGYVKNRCKNGDYYWVLANVAPIVESGHLSGYISVRRKASQEAINIHENIYRLFREKRQGQLKICYGKAIKKTLIDAGNISITSKLWGGIGMIGIFVFTGLGISWYSMSKTVSQFDNLVQKDQKLLHEYSELYNQGLQTGQALRNIILDPSNIKGRENVEKAHLDFQRHLELAKSVKDTSAEIKASLTRITELNNKLSNSRLKILELIQNGNLIEAKTILNKEETSTWREIKEILINDREKIYLSLDEKKAIIDESVDFSKQISLVLSLLTLAIGFAVAYIMSRIIHRPMNEMNATFTNLLEGNYSNEINITRNDEIGKAMQGLQILQTRIGYEVTESKRLHNEVIRIKQGLEHSPAAITFSDTNGFLVHATPRAQKLLTDISKQPFENLIFKRLVDTVLTEPKIQEDMDDAIRTGHEIDAKLGGLYLRLSARPILDDQQQILGRVTTWIDRTSEVLVEKEVQTLISAAGEGNLDHRLNPEGKIGFFRELSIGLNQLLETTSTGMRDVATVLKALSEGDLTKKVSANYQGIFGELKNDTNSTIENLRTVVRNIQEVSEAINIASKEIATGNQDLSARTEEQASSLEETSSSMEELNSTVKQNADSASEANRLAQRSHHSIERGSTVVKNVVVTMGEIQNSSHKISDIISVIDSIAFQTNILALNAAVEAARAGDQGRGFAVVASEVRSLAQRSATAAKEIKTLINESVDKVDMGVKLVEEAGITMDEVVNSFKTVAALVTDISEASHQQSHGITQVAQAVAQMDETTQQNAALVEQAAAAAESLEDQARVLNEAVSTFKTDEQPRALLPELSQLRNESKPRLKLASSSRTLSKPTVPSEGRRNSASTDEDEWAEF